MADELSNWVERQLSKNPVLTIVVVAAVGVAFLSGVGVLRPAFQAGRWVGQRLGFKDSRPQPKSGKGLTQPTQ